VKYPSATVRTLQDALDKCKRISEQKQSLTSKPKPMTTKLQEFRNKIYFTDSKMKEIAELVEQAEGVTEEISNVQSKLTRID
jgi:ppGpp synthetase/RelA/SpoT-type nucleotidyltranferase